MLSTPSVRMSASPPVLVLLIAWLAVLLQTLDLLSGIRMMLVYGVHLEQNPIARAIFDLSGPFGLTFAKATVVLGGVHVLLSLAQHGRPRLARNALIVVALLGLLGFASNLV